MDTELKTGTWDHPTAQRYVTTCILVNLLTTSVGSSIQIVHTTAFVPDILSINSNK